MTDIDDMPAWVAFTTRLRAYAGEHPDTEIGWMCQQAADMITAYENRAVYGEHIPA